MGLFGSYCLIISILGALFLFGLGVAFAYDYEYLHMEDRPSHANICYLTAAIYALFAIICAFVLRSGKKPDEDKKPKKAVGDAASSKKDKKKKKKDKKEKSKKPNPEFDSATLSTNLLVESKEKKAVR